MTADDAVSFVVSMLCAHQLAHRHGFCPAEVIYPPQATLRRALARMPGLEGAIVPGANHLPAMAQPNEVNARIVEFLQRSN